MEAVVDPIVSFGLEEAIKATRYIWKYKDLVESLKEALKSLDARHSTVRKEVDYYKDERQRVIRDDVTEWIGLVSEVSENAKKILKTFERNATGCCGVDCNCWKRYRDGRKAKDCAENIIQLTIRGEWRPSGEVCLSGFNPGPMAKYWEDGYVALPSMDEIIRQLKGFLQVGGSEGETENPKQLVMGIYGEVGVGKTTLAQKFAADMESDGVKVVVANAMFDDSEIQTQIAERVGYELTSKTRTERAGHLFNKLSRTKVLIIFDNADRRIDLREIGVPQPALGNQCRILVVSKTLDACEAMHSQKNFEIKSLTQTESKTFADGLAKNYNWTEYLLAGMLAGKEWLPAEIKRVIRTGTNPTTEPIASASTGAGIISSPSGRTDISTLPLTEGGSTISIPANELRIEHVKKPEYWRWDRTKSSVEAVLIRVWYLHIEGEATRLLPLTNYGAYFVYQLYDYANGFKINPVKMIVGGNSKHCYLDPLKSSNEKPKMINGWLNIEMGRFYTDDNPDSRVKLIVQDHDTSIVKTGLRIRGIELRQLDPS